MTPRHRAVDNLHFILAECDVKDGFDPGHKLCEPIQDKDGLRSYLAVRVVAPQVIMAGTSAGAAVLAPLECIFGLSPCRQCSGVNAAETEKDSSVFVTRCPTRRDGLT